MSKKLLCVFICLLAVLTVGCSKKPESLSIYHEDEPPVSSEESSEIETVYALNPLTGVTNLDPAMEGKRPVAITVNNIEVAQKVQTGIGNADIVYETEVEGGITRLVAIYQDTTKTDKIGTVRSARYPFIDLAMGHNAIYVHHGQDGTYARPHLSDVDRFVVSENAAGARISNGLSREHTLYAYGDKLWSAIINAGLKTENTKDGTWQSFAAEDESITLKNTATSVTVPFSASYKTTFKYDSATGKYVRYFKSTERKDYVTGQSEYFKNVFVLMTYIGNYPDGYHRQVSLTSGDGYYFVNGTYTPIKWSKGAASNGFKFSYTDGTALTVNAGNSWVCIANKNTSQPTIQ